MVSKKTITKIINKIIFDKCHLNKHLHGEFGTQIRKTLHQLTKDEPNSKEEYKILRDAIFEFYQKYNSDKNKEHTEIVSTKGEKFTVHGKSNTREVEWTSEMENVAKADGLLYSIHNHPLTTTVQSQNDLNILLQGTVKYSITLSNDGIMIIKNNNGFLEIDENYPFRNDIYFNTMRQYRLFAIEENNKCENEYPNECQNIMQRFNDNQITEEQANEEYDTIFREYSKKNKYAYVKNYINHIEQDTNLKVFHIPKIPKKT